MEIQSCENLRKMLIRVSLIADGQDDQLDRWLAEIREAIKREDDATALLIVEKLADRVIALEHEQDTNGRRVRELFKRLSSDWLNLGVERSVKSAISRFIKSLPDVIVRPDVFGDLLEELAKLQFHAIDSIKDNNLVSEETSLLSRWFGKREPSNKPEQLQRVDDQQSSEDVESHWQILLEPLLVAISPFHPCVEKIDQFRKKLSEKPGTYPTIELINELYLHIHEIVTASSSTFKNYLDSVSSELNEINELIKQQAGSHQTHHTERQQWHNRVQAHMHEFESVATNESDIDRLKQHVQLQIIHLRQSFEDLQGADKKQQLMTSAFLKMAKKIECLEQQALENKKQLSEQFHLANHDSLTGLPNRHAYENAISAELQRFSRFERATTLAVFDIDYFKKINDEYGHLAGDRVIKVLGRSIANRLREVDFFGRYGGEEFVAILPETDVATAAQLLNKIRETVANAAFNYKEKPLKVTLSIGVTQLQLGDDPTKAFERADQALYQAKSAGRNQLMIG